MDKKGEITKELVQPMKAIGFGEDQIWPAVEDGGSHITSGNGTEAKQFHFITERDVLTTGSHSIGKLLFKLMTNTQLYTVKTSHVWFIKQRTDDQSTASIHLEVLFFTYSTLLLGNRLRL